MPSENDSPNNVLSVSQTATLEEIQRYQEENMKLKFTKCTMS